MQTIGWLIAIVLAIALAFALYRPQVVKTPVASHPKPDDPTDEGDQPGMQ